MVIVVRCVVDVVGVIDGSAERQAGGVVVAAQRAFSVFAFYQAPVFGQQRDDLLFADRFQMYETYGVLRFIA